MESPYYEMTHDFEEENRLFQSGYVKGYHDAVMKCPDIVRCKDCKYCTEAADKKWREDFGKSIYECDHMNLNFVEPDWFCADGERK